MDDDKNLKVKVYNKLFEVNFDRKDYLNASNYLDSVLNIIDANTKDFLY